MLYPVFVGFLVLVGVAALMCVCGVFCRQQKHETALIEPPDHKVA